MNLLNVKAGEPIEVGAIIAWREWRYRLRPFTLLSLSFPIEWSPDCVQESDPDQRPNGIYALKARPDWSWSYIESAGWSDGYVIGQVALWGIVHEHELGYRAQHARPIKFIEARGTDADQALTRLQSMWGLADQGKGTNVRS